MIKDITRIFRKAPLATDSERAAERRLLSAAATLPDSFTRQNPKVKKGWFDKIKSKVVSVIERFRGKNKQIKPQAEEIPARTPIPALPKQEPVIPAPAIIEKEKPPVVPEPKPEPKIEPTPPPKVFSKEKLKEIFTNARTIDGKSPRFSEDEINYIFSQINDNNMECLPQIFEAKTIDKKNFRFDGRGILQILLGTNEHSKKFLPDLINAMTIDNKEFRFNHHDIQSILSVISEPNSKMNLSVLLEAKTIDDRNFRFNSKDISSIFLSLNEQNKELLPVLIDARTENEAGFRFDSSGIWHILRGINEQNKAFLSTLLSARTINGKNFRFQNTQVGSLLSSITEQNKKFIPKLLEARTIDTKEYSFDFNDISKLLSSFSVDDICYILSKQSFEEMDFEKLISLTEKFRRSISSDESKKSAFLEKIRTAIFDKIKHIKPLDTQVIGDIERSVGSLEKSLLEVDLERFGQTGLPLSADKTRIDLERIPADLRNQYKPLIDDLNAIAEAFPEFAKTIGRKQHETQAYTLDIHMLKALQETLKDPNFSKLSERDKKIAKYAVLFHDIEKAEGVVDSEHTVNTAFTVYIMMHKLNMPVRDAERITGLVRNHHWLQSLDEKKINYQDAAFLFRKPEDFEIAKIFARADIKAIGNKSLEEKLLPKLQGNLPMVQMELERIHNTGIFLPQTKVPKASELKSLEQELAGEGGATKNKVIKIDKTTDFEALGFEKGTNYDNFRVIVHAIEDGNNGITKDIIYASMDGKNGGFSGSYLSPDRTCTFNGLKSGLVFDVDNNDIINAADFDLGSSYNKSLDRLKDLLYYSDQTLFCRSGRTGFSKKYINLGNLNDSREYSKIYRELSKYHALTDIEDISSREFVDKVVKETMLNNPNNVHNELVVYAPKPVGIFTKESDPSKIPYHLRKFAEEHNLPIFMFDEPVTATL